MDPDLIPSENRHEADRAKSRQITTLHAPQYPSKKCRFPRWEIEPNVGTSRHIINHDINRYYSRLQKWWHLARIFVEWGNESDLIKSYARGLGQCFAQPKLAPSLWKLHSNAPRSFHYNMTPYLVLSSCSSIRRARDFILVFHPHFLVTMPYNHSLQFGKESLSTPVRYTVQMNEESHTTKRFHWGWKHGLQVGLWLGNGMYVNTIFSLLHVCTMLCYSICHVTRHTHAQLKEIYVVIVSSSLATSKPLWLNMKLDSIETYWCHIVVITSEEISI